MWIWWANRGERHVLFIPLSQSIKISSNVSLKKKKEKVLNYKLCLGLVYLLAFWFVPDGFYKTMNVRHCASILMPKAFGGLGTYEKSSVGVTSLWFTSPAAAGGVRWPAAHPPVSWLPNRGGSDLEENKDFYWIPDRLSPSPEPEIGTKGLGLPFRPHGRP